MSDMERLMGADSIEEWVGLHDKRLLAVTGLDRVSQEMGARLRRRWEIGKNQEAVLKVGIARLVVSDSIARTSVHKSTDVNAGYASDSVTATLGFDNLVVARQFLPLTDENIAFKNNDTRAWIVVGLAGGSLGLAIFTEEPGFEHEVEARVQAVRPELATRIAEFEIS